jgi:transcription termination factor NusB
MITDALFADYIFKTDNEMYDTAKDVLKEKFTQHEYLETAEEFKEFTDMFFSNRIEEDIDFDYVSVVALAMPKYENEIIDAVNKLTVSFTYEEMDTMDQAIFLLGYVEWKALETPKEVLLNEMIELAKRYSDA